MPLCLDTTIIQVNGTLRVIKFLIKDTNLKIKLEKKKKAFFKNLKDFFILNE